MSVEWLDGKWYITTACPEAHEDGKPCASCWPDSHDHPPPSDIQPTGRYHLRNGRRHLAATCSGEPGCINPPDAPRP